MRLIDVFPALIIALFLGCVLAGWLDVAVAREQSWKGKCKLRSIRRCVLLGMWGLGVTVAVAVLRSNVLGIRL